MNILILILLMLILLISGVRIAYALAISVLIYVFFISDMSVLLVAQRISVGADSIVMLALPFFILAGELMNASGITERLIRFALSIVGNIRGGLSFVVVITNMIMACVSGAAIASGAAVGSVMIPAMRKQGYPDGFSGAVNAVSATIGPVIPPSVGFIIFASVSNASIGKLFVAGILPGLLLGLVLIAGCYIISVRHRYPKGNALRFKEIYISFKGAFWSLLMPGIIIGGIILGIVTATEAGVIAIVYGLIVGFFFYKTLKVKDLLPILIRSAKTTAQIMMIIASAAAFGWIISREVDPQQIIGSFTSITTNKYLFMLILIAVFLLLGMVMEGGSIMIILTPLLLPVVNSMGIDIIQFGVIFQIAIMIGLVTPPVGILLYVISGTGHIPVNTILKKITPFYIAMIIALLLCVFIPEISLCLVKLFEDSII